MQPDDYLTGTVVNAGEEISEYTTEAIWQAAVTLQWQASDATNDGNGYPITDHGDEYTDAVAAIPWLVESLTAFVHDNWDDLDDMDAEQCGHDFVLTANHHGTGFWDRGLGERGKRLTESCRPYGEYDAEFTLDADGDVAYLFVLNTLITGTFPDNEETES
jgi:hypothetical protein